MRDAPTFLTNESDWSSKVNKIRKIFCKTGGGELRNFLTATAAKHKKYEKWKYLYENYVVCVHSTDKQVTFYTQIFCQLNDLLRNCISPRPFSSPSVLQNLLYFVYFARPIRFICWKGVASRIVRAEIYGK